MNQNAPSIHVTNATPANYWEKTRRLTFVLLILWFGGTFAAVFFARELNRVSLFGWPLSFYIAAQGIMLVYLAIVMVYTVRMGRAEKQFLRHTGDQAHEE